MRVRVRVGREGWVVDLLTARQNGCPVGPMKEVESEAPKITRPLAWLRGCPVQKDDGRGSFLKIRSGGRGPDAWGGWGVQRAGG